MADCANCLKLQRLNTHLRQVINDAYNQAKEGYDQYDWAYVERAIDTLFSAEE